jgi:aminoglycoside 6'-N-acetyltransferase
MIIMINGAFGVGKTTVANKLLENLDNFMLYDPEEIGFMLRHLIPNEIKKNDEQTDNFQDLEMWRSLTVNVAEKLLRTYGKNLIVPMTIYNKDYLEFIFNGFKKIDEESYHFCLTAKKETIHQRLLQRGETEGNWCFQQTDKCLTAFEEACFGKFISTDELSVAEIVKVIREDVGLISMGNFMIENENLRIRALVENDKSQLAKWLSNPKVLQYYEGRDNPFDAEKVKREFFDDEDGATRCLIEYKEKPIGYVQFYEIDGEERELYGYADSKDIIYGMDQFIGESAYWNKGIGTELITSIAAYLIRRKGADRLVMDPQTWNERAIRCYEKCGFEKVKLLPKREFHEGEYRDCWLMEYSRR